jgi:nucleotide-binding universal stress UspA family protein
MEIVARAEETVSAALRDLDTEGLDVRVVVTTNEPAQALIGQGALADLLVVGSRGRGGFRGLVLGSVSMRCALHARCPVTVVRKESVDAATDSVPAQPPAAGMTGADSRVDLGP